MNNQTKNEEIQKWKEEFAKRLIDFSVSVLRFSDSKKDNPTLWSVCNQVVRSSTSVGANVNEARGAGSKRDFIHFFQIAFKSAKETEYWFQVIIKYDEDNSREVEEILKEAQEISRILNSSLLTMKGRK